MTPACAEPIEGQAHDRRQDQARSTAHEEPDSMTYRIVRVRSAGMNRGGTTARRATKSRSGRRRRCSLLRAPARLKSLDCIRISVRALERID